MSEFKTRAEIDSASEFIQYLEKLRSGSLVTAQGTNRAFERLAENDNALLEAAIAQSLPMRVIGTWAYAAGTVSWGALSIVLPSALNGAITNTVASGSSPLAANEVLYVVVDRTASAAVVPAAATLAAFTALLASAADRLDYVVLAFGAGASGVALTTGILLRDGYAATNDGLTDTQYGQQTELTLVRENQKENLNLRLVGGGDITWDASTTTLTWNADFRLTFPASAGSNGIAAGSVSIPAGEAWYATLSRDPAGLIAVATGVASIAGGVPDTDDTFVLAIHNSVDNRVYLADGTALSDAETVKLGGVRIGVQWHYLEDGSGSQVLDLAAALGPETSYRVGSGELMVYRNGIKAISSKAYWEGGVYPAGSLNVVAGTIQASDDYIEEDEGDGSGTRIIWLGDDTGTAPVEHAAGTHDPPLQWPDSDDRVESFIGVQGQAPVVTVPNGIYGFESTWMALQLGIPVVQTNGGYLVTDGDRYSAQGSTPLTVGTLDMIGAEVLAPGDFHYIYLGPGPTTADPPDIKLSVKPPDVATTGPGVHPDFPDYRMLSSCRVLGTGQFLPFTKNGTEVTLAKDADLSSQFAGAVTGAWETVDLSGVVPPGVVRIRIRFSMTAQAAVSAGDRLLVGIRATTYPAPAQELYSIKPGNSNETEFVADILLDTSQTFEIQMDPASFQNVAEADLIGYSEGRNTSGDGLL